MKKYLDKKRFGSLVGKGNLTEVMRLLADGVNVNYKGKVLFLFDPIIALVLCLFPQEDGETPLHSACFNGIQRSLGCYWIELTLNICLLTMYDIFVLPCS